MELFQGLKSKEGEAKSTKESDDDAKLILKFLEWRKCTSPKSLENPTVNDIIDIWNCVIQTIDPSITINRSNMATIIPSLLQIFSCPFTVNKASMAAPHLGAGLSANIHFISWLCKLLIYEDQFFEFQVPNQKFYNEDFGNNMSSKEIAIGYVKRLIGDNYHIAMRSGNDNAAIDTMSKKIISTIKEDIETIGKENQSQSSHYEKVQYELGQLKNLVGLKGELSARIEAINGDIENIDGVVVQGKRNLGKREKEIDTLTNKLEEETNNLNKLNQEALELQKIITNQTLSKAEVDKLKAEISNVKSALSSIDFKKNLAKQSIPTLEYEIENSTKELYLKCQEIMTTQHKVSEMLAVHKSDYATHWIKLDAPRINISADNTNKMIGDELKRYESNLEFLMQKNVQLFQDAKNTLIKINDYIKSNKIAFKEAKNELESLQNSIASANKLLDLNRTKLDEHDVRMANMIKESRDRIRANWDKAKQLLVQVAAKQSELAKILTEKKLFVSSFWNDQVKQIEMILQQVKLSKMNNLNKLKDLNKYKENILANLE